MKRLWPWLLILLALVPALLIHGTEAAPPRVVRHSLTIAVLNDPDSLDPAQGQTLAARLVIDNVFQTLFNILPNGGVGPGLAKSESVNGLTVTIDLNHVTLSNGDPVTASLVALSLAHVLWPGTHSPGAPLLEDIRGAAAVLSGRRKTLSGLSTPNRTTLIIHLRAPDSGLVYQLANPFLAIIPVTDITHGGPFWSVTDLIGSGGYRLTGWNPRGSIVLQAVSPKIEPQTVDLEWYPYLGQAELALENGQVQAVPVAWAAMNQVIRSTAFAPHLTLVGDGGQLDLAVWGRVASTWDTAGVASTTFRRVDWSAVLRRAFGPNVRLDRGAMAGLTAGSGAPTPPASPGVGNTVSGVTGTVVLPPLPLDVSTTDPEAVRLAHALTALYPRNFSVTYVAADTLAADEAAGQVPAVLATTVPGAAWPTGTDAPAVTPLLPGGSFWLVSDGVTGFTEYPDGALNWRHLR